MGSLNQNEQRRLAYFHSLSKVMTENINQEVYNSRYKSSHSVRLSEVWSDSINYCSSFTAAYNESLTNSAVTYHSGVTLTQIGGSNGMAYYFSSGGTFIRPWISPVDVIEPLTNQPSDGFDLKLYTSSGVQIGPTTGAWSIDYYAGIIHFGQGYTPTDLGWGTPKASFFQYTGHYGASTGGTSNAFTTVSIDSGTSIIYFNSGLTNPQIVNLGYLDITGFTTTEFDSGTSILYFNRGIEGHSYVDLSSLKSGGGGSGGGGLISLGNINMSAKNTNSGDTLACLIEIAFHPITGSSMLVFVNGIRLNVGNLSTDDCYFSGDLGVTKRENGQEKIFDLLYWNYNSGIPVAGYELTTVDRLTFTYLN